MLRIKLAVESAAAGIGIEWPAVTKNDGLSCTPVFVINLRTVLGSDRTHKLLCLQFAYNRKI